LRRLLLFYLLCAVNPAPPALPGGLKTRPGHDKLCMYAALDIKATICLNLGSTGQSACLKSLHLLLLKYL
jgi:hypothetical protein